MNAKNEHQSIISEETRLAFVYGVVGKLGDTGKIRLQKILYFLQEAFGVPTGFSFRMHHYGPYSQDLDTDMIRLKTNGYLNIVSDPDGYGFHVNVADEPDGNWQEIIELNLPKIERALAMFGDKTPSELELMATLHFVDRVNDHPSTGDLVKVVNGLKPKFTPEFIESSREELSKSGILD